MNPLYTLQPNETLEREMKTTIVVWLPKFVLSFLLIILPFFFLVRLFGEGTVGVALFFVVLISGLLLGLRSFLSWSRTRLIVTSDRIIVVRQNGFFERTSREVPFASVESISVRTKGFFQWVFRYGTLKIETKGQGRVVLNALPRPVAVQEFLYSFVHESAV